MIAREYGYLLPECFYKFPVLFYDTLHSNSFSKSGDYLPDDLKKGLPPFDLLSLS
jgi:hypothetical protein